MGYTSIYSSINVVGANCVNPFLQKEGLEVTDVVVLIDREQGGRAHLEKSGIQLHAAFTMTFIVDTLVANQLLAQDIADSVTKFISQNQTIAAVAGMYFLHMPVFM